MRAAENRRRQRLVRLHLGLLAASLVLCALHAGRQLTAPTQSRAFASAERNVPMPRDMGPTINWGGQKR